MTYGVDVLAAHRGATRLVRDQVKVRKGETVLVTADHRTDAVALQCVSTAVDEAGGRLGVMLLPILPFQGRLADPYLNDMLEPAAAKAEVWLDMTWPYIAGSAVYDGVLAAGRTRYLLMGDLDADGLGRLYGTVDIAALAHLESELSRVIHAAVGKPCRVTSENGTDFSFILASGAEQLRPKQDGTGHNAPPGSVIMLPDAESVRGTIVVEAMFHEYYSELAAPLLNLQVDGEIVKLLGGASDRILAERALGRAAGNGSYGKVIHLTYGFHPRARFRGASFMEGIRHQGNNAIGLGQPFWEPDGGENHPDAVLSNQSIWLDGDPLVKDSALIHEELAELARGLDAASLVHQT